MDKKLVPQPQLRRQRHARMRRLLSHDQRSRVT